METSPNQEGDYGVASGSKEDCEEEKEKDKQYLEGFGSVGQRVHPRSRVCLSCLKKERQEKKKKRKEKEKDKKKISFFFYEVVDHPSLKFETLFGGTIVDM